VTNVRGLVLLALWDALKRERVETPSPIKDVRIAEAGDAGLAQSIVPADRPAEGRQ
jgi:hypothetical protein